MGSLATQLRVILLLIFSQMLLMQFLKSVVLLVVTLTLKHHLVITTILGFTLLALVETFLPTVATFNLIQTLFPPLTAPTTLVLPELAGATSTLTPCTATVQI